MNQSYLFRFTAIIFAMNFFITAGLLSNWQNTGNKSSFQNQEEIFQNKPAVKNTDSLPPGVSEDWLNSLQDENGNKLVSETNSSRKISEDPEGDAMQRKVFNGFGTNTSFGNSISSAGDVNGDGYSDVIVGAHNYSSGTGRAYIYYGGLNMNTVPDVIMTGEAAANYFGYSVSSAGDVNGDGYSDVIVGAYGNSSFTGKAYVYFGGASMNHTADVTMTGEITNISFGYSVSSAGDVNGDGYSDVIVGASNYSSGTGRAYVFFGGATMNSGIDVTMTGEAASNYFGNSVSATGDVNGDGYSDVIIGAYGYSFNTGRAYIFFGGVLMNNTADVTMTGETTENYFGYSVSSAGDVNGDGYSDVIAGAFYYTSGIGRAYIFFGGTSMNNSADVTMTGETVISSFGYSVSSAGDVNGDGYSDVITGAYEYSANTGRAYVFFGGALMNNTADVTMTGETADSYFGYSVSSAGDVNGDGYSDIIAGAFGYNINTGRVYLYDYYMRNDIVSDISITGEAASNQFGYSVSGAGDVNGDGYQDVIAGANNYSGGSGRSYIFFGGALMNNIADVTMTSPDPGTSFGASVSGAGDVNADGYSDVIVGGYNYGGGSHTGKAYIYYGGSVMNNVVDVILTGEALNNYFGASVSDAGDVNGDGYSDVIVGAYGYSTNTGRAYIYLGSSAMDSSPDVIMNGEVTNSYFGNSVSSAGDANGDGYSDVIVGAYGYAIGGSANYGKTYVFYGGASMNNAADFTVAGETLGDRLGYSVSSAGDVNKDGFSDLIIGAYGSNSFTGKAYVYFGGAFIDNYADMIMTGNSANNYFAGSVSDAGDVNGDGYSDLIVGANGIGKAYLFYGGANYDFNPDFIMSGESAIDLFGASVSSAGDLNNDGYSDLIVGAFGNNSYIGKSYVYLGSAISANPILISVKDLPNDQGGKVILKWARSSYDVYNITVIKEYLVQRSYPPVGGNFSWENIAVISASYEPFYTFTADTPYDSSSNNNGAFYFRITARSYNVQQFWRSAILSGRSIDNIPPLAVSPFTASSSANNVQLNWKRSSAPDLLNYILYRNTSPVINPDTEPVFATTADSSYLDTSPLSGLYYYFIVAQDIHNNKSPVAVAESPNMVLNLTMFIEGFYNSGSNSQVSDTVTVQLRNPASPYAVADQSKNVVAANGIIQLKFGNTPDGNYYLAVRHRNSIETWSAGAVALSRITQTNYNLSTASSQAYGNNMIQADVSPVRFAIFSGDVNQDGFVDGTDGSLVDNDAFNFVTGYVVTDVNGDEVVDGSDAGIVDNNAFNFVGEIVP